MMLSLAARRKLTPSKTGAQSLTRQALYDAISSSMKTNDEVKKSIAMIVDKITKLPKSELRYLREGLAISTEQFKQGMKFSEDEAFLALPFHVVFQTERFKSIFNSMVQCLEKLYRYAEQKRHAAIEKEEVVNNLMMRLVELSEIETPLSSNVKSYRRKGVFWLTVRFMFHGRISYV